jgi:toxin ParE1/3/4
MALRVSRQAEADLDDIWLYLARASASIDAATSLIEAIANRFFMLEDFPYAGRARDRDFGASSRSFPVGEYLVVYCAEGDDVLILRVVHGRRELEGLFKE